MKTTFTNIYIRTNSLSLLLSGFFCPRPCYLWPHELGHPWHCNAGRYTA